MTRAAVAATVLTVLLGACSAAPRPTSAATSPATTTQHAGSQHAALSQCPAAVALSSLRVLAHVSGDPDDVTVDADGVSWLSDRDGLRILQLDSHGSVLRTFADPAGPEGIVVLADGTVIVAQQVTDRLDVLHVATGAFTAWLQLGATSSPTEGVDGISLDASTVLVPDSAHGRLLSVAVGPRDTARTPTVVATGLGRPVAAIRAPSGAYYAALENQPGLAVVQPGASTATPVVHADALDDLVFVRGLVYATDLADQSVIAIDPASGAMRTLVSGSPAPQGLALTLDGGLLLVDSTARVLLTLRPC